MRWLPYAVLAVALVAVSHGAIFARLADAEPLAIAAWRLGIAFLVILPTALGAGRGRIASTRHALLAMLAGVLLALHFATWISSLEYTSVARSVLLVCTAPVWVALLQFVMGQGVPSRITLASLLLALAGIYVIGSGALDAPGALKGDLLALAGAVAMAGYLLLAREAQSTLGFRQYLLCAYGSAAAVLWLAVFVSGVQVTGFDATTWAALAGMALVSQLVGHSGYNWSLRHLNPAFVAVVLLGEPVLAALLAWLLLGETPETRTYAAALLILAAIILGARAARRA